MEVRKTTEGLTLKVERTRLRVSLTFVPFGDGETACDENKNRRDGCSPRCLGRRDLGDRPEIVCRRGIHGTGGGLRQSASRRAREGIEGRRSGSPEPILGGTA